MRGPYIVRSGGGFGEPAKGRQVGLAILSCALGTGIGLCLALASDSGIIAGILSSLKDLGTAIWTMCCKAAHACADFVHYVMRARSG